MYDQQHPAPGYRHRDTGSANYVGHTGYSWSSAVDNIDGVHLHFYIIWLSPCNTSSRSYGFQLRCLSQ